MRRQNGKFRVIIISVLVFFCSCTPNNSNSSDANIPDETSSVVVQSAATSEAISSPDEDPADEEQVYENQRQNQIVSGTEFKPSSLYEEIGGRFRMFDSHGDYVYLYANELANEGGKYRYNIRTDEYQFLGESQADIGTGRTLVLENRFVFEAPGVWEDDGLYTHVEMMDALNPGLLNMSAGLDTPGRGG